MEGYFKADGASNAGLSSLMMSCRLSHVHQFGFSVSRSAIEVEAKEVRYISFCVVTLLVTCAIVL